MTYYPIHCVRFTRMKILSLFVITLSPGASNTIWVLVGAPYMIVHEYVRQNQTVGLPGKCFVGKRAAGIYRKDCPVVVGLTPLQVVPGPHKETWKFIPLTSGTTHSSLHVPTPPQFNFIRNFWRLISDTWGREQNEGKEGKFQAPFPSHGGRAVEPSEWVRLDLYPQGVKSPGSSAKFGCCAQDTCSTKMHSVPCLFKKLPDLLWAPIDSAKPIRLGIPLREPYYFETHGPWIQSSGYHGGIWGLVRVQGKRAVSGMAPLGYEKWVGRTWKASRVTPSPHQHLALSSPSPGVDWLRRQAICGGGGPWAQIPEPPLLSPGHPLLHTLALTLSLCDCSEDYINPKVPASAWQVVGTPRPSSLPWLLF